MADSGRRFWLLAAITLLGVYAQIAQALLIRESLVVFYGNEISLGVFFGSWLLWVAIGSVLIARWRDRPFLHRPADLLARLLWLLPLLLLGQIAALRSVRMLFDIPSVALIPLGDLFVCLGLITVPGSLVIGLAFPLACKALSELDRAGERVGRAVAHVSRLYLLEAFGALLGGMLFTFVMAHWGLIWQGLGLLSILLALVVWRLAEVASGGLRVAAGLLMLAASLLVLTPLPTRLHTLLEQWRFATLQPGMTWLDAVETRYGHVAFARLGEQISVLNDGRVAESFPLQRETEQLAAYVYAQSRDASRILMFGGFASGLATELLRYPVRQLDVLEQDRRAFEALRRLLPPSSQQALADTRLQLHFIDGRRFTRERLASGKAPTFDLVLALHPVPSSAHGNRYFTLEFYRQIKRLMSPGGVYCTQVSSASNYLGATVSSYAGSVLHTLQAVFAQVAIMPGDHHLYCAADQPSRVSEDAWELAARYRQTPLPEHRFPALSFHSLLPPERIRYVREQLAAQRGALNSDDQPITYYLNMLLWGQFSASGFSVWLSTLKDLAIMPYLVPLAVFLLLWLSRCSLEGFARPTMRRHASAYGLAVLGMVAMAVQLVIVFAYQSSIGFMFERIALLNALFMSGLALGAGVIGQWLARQQRNLRYLSLLLLCIVALLPGLGLLLSALHHVSEGTQEMAYYVLSVLLGVLTGIGFPLAVSLTYQDVRRIAPSAALAEAADSFGGALGGFLTGALLVPIVGVRGTLQLLAILALSALLPLAYARFAPSRMAWLASRGRRSLPWNALAWLLAFVVLTAFGWEVAGRGEGAEAQVHFGDNRLMQVSGSARFELSPQPFVFYRGWDAPQATAAPPDTASLSSMTVASDINGYAGPLNLLVAVDAAGKLRGVHYLDSDETPTYIAGLQDWLETLRGVDLSAATLNLAALDALSGATLSSTAALQAINRSVQAVAAPAFSKRFAPSSSIEPMAPTWQTPRFLATLALLLLFIPAYLSGQERARLGLLLLSLLVLGCWLNSLVSEVDLVNLSLGHWPAFSENPQRWLLLAFVLVSGVLLGQVWCGYLCPFGALQEIFSRIGRFLGWRRYPQRAVEARLRFLKFVLLSLLLLAVWWRNEPFWASFNPMQHAFGWRWDDWMLALLCVTLLSALFYFRFWCRYFCPFGAFLALTNKIALLQRFAPQRRFQHCDLGVADEFDIDCIRCNRCLTGHDCGVRHQPPGRIIHDGSFAAKL